MSHGGLLDQHEDEHLRTTTWALMFADSPIPLWVYDLENLRFLDVNDAAIQAYGHTRDEFLGMTIADIRPPDEVDRLREDLGHPRPDLQNSGEWVHLHKSGRRMTVEVRSHRITFRSQPSVLVAVHDLTDRKVAESQRDRIQVRYRELFERAQDLIYTLRPDGTIVDVNPTSLAILGYKPAELIGTNVEMVIAPEHLEASRAMFSAKAEGGLPQTLYELEAVTKAGAKRLLEVASWLATADDGGVLVHGIARDVTDRREAEEHLRQAERLESVARLAAGVAHDLNNELTVVRGYASMAAAAASGSQLADLEEVVSASERAEQMVRQLLAFGQRAHTTPALVDVNQCLTELHGALKMAVGARAILELDQEDSLGLVSVDRVHLSQVMLNLVINARDAVIDAGHIIVRTRKLLSEENGGLPGKPGWVTISVVDNGCGMDEATLTRVFDPFFTTKGPGGTGLGMSSAHGLVAQMAGEIRVSSAPGCGTVVTVLLPTVR